MIRTYDDLMATADAYADSRTLLSGVELEVFTHIGNRSLTARQVAHRARTPVEGMELLLNALTGMGLLAKNGPRFRCNRISHTYLDAASPRAVTHFLWLAGQHWEDWMQLTQALRRKRRPSHSSPPDDPAFRRRFALALHERSRHLIPLLTRPIRLGRAKSLLDLGGGAGSYAMALVQKTPGLHATVFDRPVAVKVARAQARQAGLADRMSVIGGDLFKDDYGGPYDVVFYSNVIHIYGARENLRILKKVKKALRPGGRILVVEYFLGKDHAHPRDVALFNLMMYLFTATGHCYTWDEVSQWLKQIGFARFRRTHVTDRIGILEAVLRT